MSVATDIDRLVAREHHDPHSLLGAHDAAERRRRRARAAPGGRVASSSSRSASS